MTTERTPDEGLRAAAPAWRRLYDDLLNVTGLYSAPGGPVALQRCIERHRLAIEAEAATPSPPTPTADEDAALVAVGLAAKPYPDDATVAMTFGELRAAIRRQPETGINVERMAGALRRAPKHLVVTGHDLEAARAIADLYAALAPDPESWEEERKAQHDQNMREIG